MTTNVLADRHHAGLYRSLQLLADRLGWTLYTPTGPEWWDDGVWNFGRSTYGDDRLARQFLGASGPDEEYPLDAINYVTLAEARAMDWRHVIATVPDNQEGFAQFAREAGATYVVQCGNTGQYIDWSLNPIVLNSSEMPLLGRGITYHQELDPVFRYRPPTPWHIIRSFVHLMHETHAFPLWLALREELRNEFLFLRYGHAPDGPDPTYMRNAKPIGAIASLMAMSAFGWHDKPVGDGHGHVIHGWAASGRPLIGHASHYAGKLAEPFWTPDTAIDLDQHTIPEAARLLRDIIHDPGRHEAMCRAMRAAFDANVDYEAEAEAIRGVLA